MALITDGGRKLEVGLSVWPVTQRLQTILRTKMCSNFKVELPQLAVPFLTNPRSQAKNPRIWTFKSLFSNFLVVSEVCIPFCDVAKLTPGVSSSRVDLHLRLGEPRSRNEPPEEMAFLDGESLIVFFLSVVWLRCIKWIIKWYNSDITVICDT